MDHSEATTYKEELEVGRKAEESTVCCSVIMPVHNAAEYLKEALDTVCAQTLSNVEIICVDDCSTDESGTILEKCQSEDKRIRIIKNDSCIGAGESRNIGIQNATGKYLAILDSDDIFKPNMLEQMYLKAEGTGADVVVCDFIQHNQNTGTDCLIRVPNWLSKKWEKDNTLSKQENRVYAFETVMHAPWNKLYRREFVLNEKLHFSNVKAGNDILFGDTVIIKADSIVYMGEKSEPLLFYRYNHGNQISGKKNILFFDLYQAIIELGKYILDNNELRIYRRPFINYFSHSIALLLKKLDENNRSKFCDYFRDNWKSDLSFEDWKKDDFYNPDELEKFVDIVNEKKVEDMIYGLLTYRFDAEFWEKLKSLGNRPVLWGIGSYAESFLRKCDENDYYFTAVIDKKKKKDNKCGRYEISRPEDVDFSQIDIIVVYSSLYFDDILSDIRRFGINKKAIDIYAYYSNGLFNIV